MAFFKCKYFKRISICRRLWCIYIRLIHFFFFAMSLQLLTMTATATLPYVNFLPFSNYFIFLFFIHVMRMDGERKKKKKKSKIVHGQCLHDAWWGWWKMYERGGNFCTIWFNIKQKQYSIMIFILQASYVLKLTLLMFEWTLEVNSFSHNVYSLFLTTISLSLYFAIKA